MINEVAYIKYFTEGEKSVNRSKADGEWSGCDQ